MGDIKDIKDKLVQKARDGEITPSEAFATFEKITPAQHRAGRVYTRKSPEQRAERYFQDKEIRDRALKNKIPFLSPSFLPNFYLTQGLTVVGAKTGKGKSTTCAGIIAGVIEHTDKNVMVISNEEASDANYEKVACVLLKKNYLSFFNRSMPERERQTVINFVRDHLLHRIEIASGPGIDTHYIEDVQAVIESAQDCGIILIDYLQTIRSTRSKEIMSIFDISKKLGAFCEAYGERGGCPIVALAQLSEDGDNKEIQDRVQNDKHFVNSAFLAIEVIPDFETLTTKFKVCKDRNWGHTGKEVIMDFKGGRYEPQGGEII